MNDLKMVQILKTNNQSLLAVFESVLNGAEIPYFIRGAEAASLMPLNATIVVPEPFAEAAKELLRETQDAHESSEEE
jgi:hypothetical protein